MNIPRVPVRRQDGISVHPFVWFGAGSPDGDAGDWVTAPVNSVYVQITATNLTKRFVKVKNDARDDDWVQGLHALTQRFTRAQMTDGGSTLGTLTLAESIPVGAFVLQSVLEDVTGFIGDTSAVITLSDGSDVDRYNTGTPSVFTTAAAIDLGVPSGLKIHTAAIAPIVRITSTADFTNVTAGAATVRIYYLH